RQLPQTREAPVMEPQGSAVDRALTHADRVVLHVRAAGVRKGRVLGAERILELDVAATGIDLRVQLEGSEEGEGGADTRVPGGLRSAPVQEGGVAARHGLTPEATTVRTGAAVAHDVLHRPAVPTHELGGDHPLAEYAGERIPLDVQPAATYRDLVHARQVGDLVAHRGQRDGQVPPERVLSENLHVELRLRAPVLRPTAVDELIAGEAEGFRERQRDDRVRGGAPAAGEGQPDAIVEERRVDPQLQLLTAFRGEIRVTELGGGKDRLSTRPGLRLIEPRGREYVGLLSSGTP